MDHHLPQFQSRIEEIKCRSHPSQVADLFLNDPKQNDLFKCIQCVSKNNSLASKVTTVNSIIADKSQKLALNLYCEESDLYEEAELFVYSSNDLLEKINFCFKEVQEKIIDLLNDINREFIAKAQLILAKKATMMKEYNDKCGRQKLKNIIEDNNIQREQKEIKLKQLNEELGTEVNRKKVAQTLARLRDLQPQIHLENEQIKNDLVKMLIQKLNFSFSCGRVEQLLNSEQVFPLNCNSLQQTVVTRMAIQMKSTDGSAYVGLLKGEENHSFGVKTWPNGDLYIGEFKDNEKYEQGTYTWSDGQKYVGEFKNDKRNGLGIWSWPDGSQYFGEFQNGHFNGRGMQKKLNGEILNGIWKDDNFIGQ